MGSPANSLNPFQDRITRVPGLFLPNSMKDPNKPSYANYYDENAGDLINSRLGMLGEHLGPQALELIKNIAGQWSKNKKDKGLVTVNEGAPQGSLQHELGHALLKKILLARPDIQNPGDESFAYGISNPTGATQDQFGQPIIPNVVPEMMARLRSRPGNTSSNMLSTEDPNQKFIEQMIRLQMAGKAAGK